MEQSFEQGLPLAPIIVAFMVLMVANFFLRKKMRERHLIKQGQLAVTGAEIPSIEKRIAANKEWASGEIRAGGRGLLVALWIAAIGWFLVIDVSFIRALLSPTANTTQRVVLGVLSLGGIALVAFAAYLTIRKKRFGESWCRIKGKAGVLGQDMSGTVRTSNEFKPNGDYTFELKCTDTFTTGSGKNRSTTTKVHYEATSTVPSAGKVSRSGIPFSFSLPSYAPETGYPLARGRVDWELRVKAPVEGVDYSARFTIPVFKMN